jgi:hypothetical protein
MLTCTVTTVSQDIPARKPISSNPTFSLNWESQTYPAQYSFDRQTTIPFLGSGLLWPISMDLSVKPNGSTNYPCCTSCYPLHQPNLQVNQCFSFRPMGTCQWRGFYRRFSARRYTGTCTKEIFPPHHHCFTLTAVKAGCYKSIYG